MKVAIVAFLLPFVVFLGSWDSVTTWYASAYYSCSDYHFYDRAFCLTGSDRWIFPDVC